jgi:hypothetical protein
MSYGLAASFARCDLETLCGFRSTKTWRVCWVGSKAHRKGLIKAIPVE